MTVTQRCSSGNQCIHPDGPDLPATNEFFYEDNRCDSPRLVKRCKKCKCKNVNETSDPVKRRAAIDRWQKEHPEKVRAAVLKWSRAHKEHKRDYDHNYRTEHPKHDENARQWKKNNKDRVHAQITNWRADHPEKWRLISQRWRARKRQLPDTLTQSEWQHSLEYFSACAYCGHGFDDQHQLTADHFIPISAEDCPGTTRENILPSCHCCNYSKHNRRAEDWLSKKFGETESYLILQRVQSYFDHLKQLHSR